MGLGLGVQGCDLVKCVTCLGFRVQGLYPKHSCSQKHEVPDRKD